MLQRKNHWLWWDSSFFFGFFFKSLTNAQELSIEISEIFFTGIVSVWWDQAWLGVTSIWEQKQTAHKPLWVSCFSFFFYFLLCVRKAQRRAKNALYKDASRKPESVEYTGENPKTSSWKKHWQKQPACLFCTTKWLK